MPFIHDIKLAAMGVTTLTYIYKIHKDNPIFLTNYIIILLQDTQINKFNV